MYTYRIYLDGGNLVIGTYESNVLKGEAKHLPRGLVAIAGNTNTTITINRVVNNLSTLTNIEHPDLRDGNGNVWGATRTAVIAAINSFIQSTGGGNVISVNGQTGTVSLGLQNLVNVTTITPTQGDVLSYNSSGNWVLNSGLQYLLSKVKSATATQTSLEVNSNYKINIDSSQNKTTIVHNGTSVATFGAKALLPAVTIGTAGTTYDLPAARGTADGQVPVFNVTDNTTSFQAVKVADLSGSTDDLTQGATNLFFTSAEQSKLAGIQSGAEVNVNADWNSSSGDSQILNKPTLSTVATSGSYNDLSNLPSIPAAYTDSSVDAHLNTATATTGQILSWTGSDYDWVLDAAGAPAGTVGQLQYNNSGIFGASSNLFWDISNNRLGIGTSTPAQSLHILGDIQLGNITTNAPNRTLRITGYDDPKIEFNLHDNWAKPTIAANLDGTIKFVNLGVVTSNLKFQFGESASRQGSMRFYTNSNDAISFGTNAAYPLAYIGVNEESTNYQGGILIKTRDSTTVTNNFYFSRAGNFGIGTITPTDKLQANGSILSGVYGFVTPVAGKIRSVSPNTSYGEIGFSSQYNNLASGLRSYGVSDTTYARDLRFYVNDDTADSGDGDERMRITHTGNVGIGTATPTTKLDVNGAIYSNTSINVGLTPVSGRYLNVRTNNLNSGSAMYAQAVHGDGRWALYGTADTSTHRLIYVWHGSSKMVGWGEGGNAGGVSSPMATQGNTGEVYFSTDKRLIWYNNGLGPLNTPVPLVISTNTTTNIAEFYSTTINNTNLVQAAGFQYSANYHRFRTGNTTDGSTLPNTQEGLYISQEGRVGIGTITPSEKLQVNGNLKVSVNSGNLIIGTSAANTTAIDLSGYFTNNGAIKIVNSNDRGFTTHINTQETGLRSTYNGTTQGSTYIVSYYAAIGNLNNTNGTTDISGFSFTPTIISETGTTIKAFRSNLPAANNRYNLYLDGTAQNYIAGNVGIGTTTPSEKLHVVGKINLNDGSNNVLISTGNSTITAANTTAVGYQALMALTTGEGNTAIGYQAGDGITTAAYNTLVGYGADVGTANSSTAVGYQASGVGSRVVAIGYQTQGGVITNGYQNVGIGYQANYQGASERSIAIGAFAAYNSTIKSVAVGERAAYNGSDYSVMVGHEAGQNATADYTVAVGYQALTALTTGANNTAIGYQAGLALTSGAGNTLIGNSVGTAITTGPSNILIGNNAGRGITNQGKNIAIGNNSNGTSNSSGNVAIGHEAIGNGGSGVAIGENAGRFEMSQGAFVGNDSGYLAGDNSVGLGWTAGAYARGNNNVSIGHSAGKGVAYTSNFSNTVAVGYEAGTALTTGGSNILIGYQAGSTLTTESNKLYIENSNSATPLIYGEFDTDLVRINGSFQVTSTTTSAGLYASNQTELRLYELTANGTNYIALKAAGTLASDTTYTLPTADGSAGQALTTDASGNMSWAYPKSPVKSEAGTAYTLVLADAGKYIRMTAATAITITIPQDTFAVGDEFFFEQNNTGQVTVAAGTGVTLRNTAAFLAKTAERYAIVGLKCVASNEFILTGERELV